MTPMRPIDSETAAMVVRVLDVAMSRSILALPMLIVTNTLLPQWRLHLEKMLAQEKAIAGEPNGVSVAGRESLEVAGEDLLDMADVVITSTICDHILYQEKLAGEDKEVLDILRCRLRELREL